MYQFNRDKLLVFKIVVFINGNVFLNSLVGMGSNRHGDNLEEEIIQV